MVFKYFQVEAGVSTTKNNTTESCDIMKNHITSYRHTVRRHDVPHSPAHLKSTLIIWLYPESFKLQDLMFFLFLFIRG